MINYLNTGDERSSKDTRKSFNAKENTDNQRGEHDESARWNHLLDGSIRRDLDTSCVVRLSGALHEPWDGVELAANFLHHLEGGAPHALHCHSREPVREHCTHDQADEHLWS